MLFTTIFAISVALIASAAPAPVAVPQYRLKLKVDGPSDPVLSPLNGEYGELSWIYRHLR